ncbi:MAG: class I SAM-dependent methyltransferase [Candidatus Microthrix parvicella]|jgi:SAM-dependent methyltransferase|uniref:class I SAM-dependent methyltransferase n=1 Tax=Candidatus Neomicrothrix sp. TaxID=2719034 RepID=UPI0016BD4DDC|nr:class I SAM-dependent methyltransferase [Candidatus Microthrix sp.]NLH66627.1 class I SAM-dependent methyltransferase [Candidatus Microthrix parvicella]MBK6503735.1 class I SAM-dependent methyltransferase [Candidatus Microthrix sp.]MBK7019553.1 class I SAM-dependent methyltransferase [Candidatus Microthrix sp.]MBK7324531.1 class I SAM-dependent methyltransferase [Candidatus Microthrix sp.]MBL0204717.1 class I SAM-dependent methyltransferase [Candidatus Microthrix sp.]
MIRDLPVVIGCPAHGPPDGLSADHPLRTIARDAAFDPDAWTDERRRQLIALFDTLAEDWSSRDVPGREAPILDALDRGLAAAPSTERRVAIDVGAADGINDRHLTPTFPDLITLDLSLEMLRSATDHVTNRVQADGSGLPVADRSVDVILLINAFLFPIEIERVLAPNGVLIWVNSRGAATPIGLPSNDVDQALPGEWAGVASSAGWGTWSVHWRS